MKNNKLLVGSQLIFALILVSFIACGQNPNIRQKKYRLDAETSLAEDVTDESTRTSQPGGETRAGGAANSLPTHQGSLNAPLPGQSTTTGEGEPESIPSTLSTGIGTVVLPSLPPIHEVPAPSPEVPSSEGGIRFLPSEPITGQDGMNGKDGQNGRDGKDGQDSCGIRPVNVAYPIRPLTADETKTVVLPYRSAGGHTIQNLKIGQMNSLLGGHPVVRDSQITFASDVFGLPPRNAIQGQISAKLRMKLTKVSLKDPYTRTEMICLLDERICSGEAYSDPAWQGNFNPTFFKGLKKPVYNSFFAEQYLEHEVGRSGNQRIYSGEVILPVEDLLRGSEVSSIEDLIFKGIDPNQDMATKKTIRWVLADDTFVSAEASLLLSYSEDTCKTFQIRKRGKK